MFRGCFTFNEVNVCWPVSPKELSEGVSNCCLTNQANWRIAGAHEPVLQPYDVGPTFVKINREP